MRPKVVFKITVGVGMEKRICGEMGIDIETVSAYGKET